MRELSHPGLFDNYRVCPECDGLFTVDRDTKYRQAVALFIVLISLVFTLLLYFDSSVWLFPAVASYLALGLFVFWGNSKVYLVPYKKSDGSDKNG